MSTLQAVQEAKQSVRMTPEEYLKLPFSRQLELALEDLEALEKTPGHRIYMETWVLNKTEYLEMGGRETYSDSLGDVMDDSSTECVTCLAGSTMLRRFDGQTFFDMAVTNLPLASVMERISDIALSKVVPYKVDPVQFKEGIRFHIERLRTEGK